MKCIPTLIAITLTLTGCYGVEHKIEECITTTGSDIICAQYAPRIHGDQQGQGMTVPEWIAYNELTDYIEANEVPLSVLAQAYADAMRLEHNKDLHEQ